MSSCPTDNQLAEYAASPSDFEAVGGHIDACAICRVTVAKLADLAFDSVVAPDGETAQATFGDQTRPDSSSFAGSATAPTPGDDGALPQTPGDDGAPPGRSRALPQTPGRGASIGRYLVLSLIGRGGMGEVYEAYDPELDRRVALKLLYAARGAEGARRRLLREARALGKLSHPNVVQVYDVSEHEGDVFVAMELVEGQALDVWCKGPPRAGWQDVLAAYLDAARGLGAAHAKGIVHRDVKPANILRGKDGRVCVADFGLAAGRSATALAEPRHAEEPAPAGEGFAEGEPLGETVPAPSDPAGDRDERLTATGALLGTPLYMAPEQFEGSAVGPASDQHSLCTALYEGLYGALPFPAVTGPGTLVRLLARKKEGPPPAPPAGSPVPASVHRALARGLASRPEDRFPSIEALADALRKAAAPRRRAWLRSAVIEALAVIVLAVAGVRTLWKLRVDPREPHGTAVPSATGEDGWRISGGGHYAYAIQVDAATPRNGHPTLLLAPRAETLGKYGTWMRLVDATPYRGKRVRFSAYTRTEGASHGADFWARVQAADSPGDGFGLAGRRAALPATSDWTRREFVLDVAAAAASLEYAVGMAGPGKLWIDEARIEVVGDDVPVSPAR